MSDSREAVTLQPSGVSVYLVFDPGSRNQSPHMILATKDDAERYCQDHPKYVYQGWTLAHYKR